MEKASARLATLARHLDGVVEEVEDGKYADVEADVVASRIGSAPRDDDIVIVSALRTPIGKARRGGFKDTTPDVLLRTVLSAVVERTGIDPAIVGDVAVGNVLQTGAGAAGSRIGQLVAGYPFTVPLHAVNRQCSSGLQAFVDIAGGIATGAFDCGVAAGVESMSLGSMGEPPSVDFDAARGCKAAMACTIPMGITSETVAERYGVTREEQDELAALSQERACRAWERGWMDAEVVPVATKVEDADGNEKDIVVSRDEGLRPGTTAAKLGKLRAAFKPGGSTTAGNSSQVSDGAAAVLVMTRRKARELRLPILGVFRSYAVVGVSPDEMGIGPAEAIPVACEKAGLTVDEVDVFEINEAFASQCLYCAKKLGIPLEKLNPKGGAIALGHPLGCTGARQIATLLHELKRTGKKTGIVSMCIGTGMGMAAVFTTDGV
eukprot:PLAT4762.1.p2 GENE.PLAT4762.1~~PLAT4762.1.p2  ORF type:complete len:451 (-),score=177.65 PLAT4762.1:89-1393(-)